ncbi:MAG: transcription termination factor Rho [Planctomycetes bacterium]|nr:transcription termination factor Rho [Planctomycetota bacterium]
MLEIAKEGYGFLRSSKHDYEETAEDAFVPANLIRRHSLREGCLVEGQAYPGRGRGNHLALETVEMVDGFSAEEAARFPQFRSLTSIDPDERYVLEGPDGDPDLRIIDLLTPLGKGQRALIVAPPRTGKTVILEKIGNRIVTGYPNVHLMVALVDERPEEATHFKRAVPERAEVIASTNDEPGHRHLRCAELVIERARRLVEAGREVVVLMDSLTRLGRAYNLETKNSGRTLSGGLDAKVLEKPKAFFGAARNVEGGGSLTIVATALIDTGSRLDQVIFEEFKGTGNMELVLSRTLADRRTYPAIDINLSGTRREELLVSPETLHKIHLLRRVLNRMRPIEAMELLTKKIRETRTNAEFLARFDQIGAATISDD